jgi:hypothetical protein
MAFNFYGTQARKPVRLGGNVDFGEEDPMFDFYGAQPAGKIGFDADFSTIAQNPLTSGMAKSSPAPAKQSSGFDPLSTALGIGSQIFSYLGGGGQRKRKKEIYGDLGKFSSQVGGLKGRLNATDLYAKTVAGYAPQIRQFDEQMSRRYGFDSGVAGKYLAQKLTEFLGRLRPELEETSAGYDLNALTSAANIKSAQGQYA